jgi:hypothetical protein
LERADAIEDAKSMHENPAVVAVKVIKETYDPETHATYESTVFSTEAAKPAIGEKKNFSDMEVDVGGPDFADMTIGEGGFEDDYEEPKKKNKKAAKGKSTRSPIGMIFLKILTITTVSLVIAFVATFAFTGSLFD